MNLQEVGFSRFIKTTDYNANEFIYRIDNSWWSRLYEYPWASNFAEKEDICLDAACGIGHHLKYYLAENCKEVFACDLENLLSDREAMFRVVLDNFGQEAYDRIMKNQEKIKFSVCNLTQLPYEDKKFNKIYCVSVLEHMSPMDRKKTFEEFKRTLKDDGIMIITMDYPSVSLNEFKDMLDSLDLKFKFGYDFDIPSDVLVSTIYPGLKCFRAIICK